MSCGIGGSRKHQLSQVQVQPPKSESVISPNQHNHLLRYNARNVWGIVLAFAWVPIPISSIISFFGQIWCYLLNFCDYFVCSSALELCRFHQSSTWCPNPASFLSTKILRIQLGSIIWKRLCDYIVSCQSSSDLTLFPQNPTVFNKNPQNSTWEHYLETRWALPSTRCSDGTAGVGLRETTSTDAR